MSAPHRRPSGASLPPQSCYMTVTPQTARDWLDNRCFGKQKRVRSAAAVGRYMRQMAAGKWMATPEAVMFDTYGQFVNGMTRIAAVAALPDTHPGVEFRIEVDVPSDVFDVIDQGLKRTANQFLPGKYAFIVAGGARYLMPGHVGRYHHEGTMHDVLRTVQAWPELTRFAADAMACAPKGHGKVPPSPHVAILAMAARTDAKDRIEAWVSGIATGEDLSQGDPRLLVRRRFEQGGARSVLGQRSEAVGKLPNRRALVFETIVRGWNAWAEQRPLARLLINGVIPPVSGFKNGSGS